MLTPVLENFFRFGELLILFYNVSNTTKLTRFLQRLQLIFGDFSFTFEY